MKKAHVSSNARKVHFGMKYRENIFAITTMVNNKRIPGYTYTLLRSLDAWALKVARDEMFFILLGSSFQSFAPEYDNDVL